MRAKRLSKVSPLLAQAVCRSGTGLMAVSIALAPVSGHAAETCRRTTDEKSVYMRSLQTNLMVAALTCSASDQYNDFIHRFQPVLKTDGERLRGYFKKKHGKAGAEELNTFVTRLANDESERSIQEGQAAYCDNAAKLFPSVLVLNPKEIDDFAATLPISSEAPVRPPCGPVIEPGKPISAAAPGAATPEAGEPGTNGVTVETK